MKIRQIGNCELRLPSSGGKAGKHRNRTSNVQVRQDGCLVRQFRFEVDDVASYRAALKRAVDYAQTKSKNQNQDQSQG